MPPDVVTLLTIVLWSLAICAMFGVYVAAACQRGSLEGILHGALLGPFGLILVALYPRPGVAEAVRISERRAGNEQLTETILNCLKDGRATIDQLIPTVAELCKDADSETIRNEVDRLYYDGVIEYDFEGRLFVIDGIMI